MPDITMCRGYDCPKKESCYRFTASPDEYQSYFLSTPNEGDKCDLYWGETSKSIWDEINEIFKIK